MTNNNCRAMESDLQIPAGFRPLENQVAGHTFTDQSPSLGMLMQENSGCVLKPLNLIGKPECGKRELDFYETLQVNNDPMVIKLKTLVPKFYNKVKLIVNKKEHIFIKLENLTHNMLKPCIMDVKIGRRTWDPLATEQKRSVEEQKYAKCKKSLGLCLPGFQLHSLNKDGSYSFIRNGKEYGKQLDESGFCDTIALFLNSQKVVCRPLVEEVLEQLYSIRSWFTSQSFYHFYASSILVVYDAAALIHCNETIVNGHSSITENHSTVTTNSTNSTLNHSNKATTNIHNIVKVRMIDFAHVFQGEDSLDSNYLFGLRSLITILENLLQR